MQLSRRCAGAAAVLFLAATPEASPNSLSWKPNEFDDVQDLLADDATDNLASAVVAEHKAAPKPQGLKAPAVVKLAKHGVQTQNKFANPLLDSYLGDSDVAPRASGGEFSTQWNVKAKAVGAQPVPEGPREIPDEANAYIRDLHGEEPTVSLKDKFAARRAATSVVPTMPLSKVLGSSMKDAVVTAEEWEQEDRGSKQTASLAAATRWGSPHLRGPETSLAASRVAVKAGASAGASDANPYMTLLGATQEVDSGAAATHDVKNPYLGFFRSDKEKVQDEASAAEKLATTDLESHHGQHNSYLNSIVPDSAFISVSGR